MNTINRKKAHRILLYESVGFIFLIALSWLNELISLPHLIFGSSEHSSLHEAMIETVALVVVWLIVTVFTSHLLGRLYYFEGFLRVCAWCRKIGHEEDWSTVETYFTRGFDVKTSHGMCPECERKWEGKSERTAAADATSSKQP